jgi:aminoglycoside phosphotransferase (APT) family kinase protein
MRLHRSAQRLCALEKRAYRAAVHTELDACLPLELRGPDTRIAAVSGGLSGAGVYRVDVGGRAWVLKVAQSLPPTELLRAASAAGVAPRVVHIDEARRAVVSEFVVDRSFAARFGAPATRATALEELGVALRRVHALPISPGASSKDPRAFLAEIWASLGDFLLPAWVGDAVRRALDEAPPPTERAPVLSHNDVNPSNVVYDGQRVLFLDWDSAGANDPFADLATVAVFFRMDDATSARLISTHDEAPVSAQLPARFIYLRRMIAALCGVLFLNVARERGHAGGETALELALTLGEVQDRMRAGMFSARTPEGQWQFGLALLKLSVQLFA